MVISSSANAENERVQHKTLTNRRFKSQTSINENDELEEVDYDDDDDHVATDDSEKNDACSGRDQSKETNSKTTDDKSTSQEHQQRNSSLSANKKVPKQRKWKPLVIEPAKRERRSYRTPQYQPDAYKSNNERTRSLDRAKVQQQQSHEQQQPQQQENIKPIKDLAQTSTQLPYTRPYQRPIRAARYDRSTKSYKTHRFSITTTGQTSQGPSAPRENLKDYLCGDNAIIVDNLPVGFVYSPASIAPTLPPTAVYYANPYEILMQNICYQIEYYFSDENLTSDIYLRRKMDANGYIDLNVLASFNRIQALTQDIQVLVDAIKHSSLVEVNMQELKLRRRDNPEKWPLKPILETHHLNPGVPEFVPRSMSMNFTLGNH
jgi:hypothetical protein